MKMKVFVDSKEYNIRVEAITQICGTNIVLKNKVLQQIKKHFEGSKSTQKVLIDGEEIGKSFADLFYIENKDGMASSFKLVKNTLINQYILQELQNIEMQKELDDIELCLSKMFEDFNLRLREKVGDVTLRYEIENIFDMVQKTVITGANGESVGEMDVFDLVVSYLKLQQSIWEIQPCKKIIVFNNIDHLLTRSEYRKLLDKCDKMTKEYDVYFLFSISIDGYVVIDENNISGINIFNDEIFFLDELDNIKEFVVNNYPVNIYMEKGELIKKLERIINYIGDYQYEIDIKPQVLLKLLNSANAIKTKVSSLINNQEIAFLSDNNVV